MYNIKLDGISSAEYGLYIKTKSLPLLPQKRIQKETVMGRDGTYNFFNGYEDKVIILHFEYAPNISFLRRRQQARLVASWLLGKELVFDYEADKYYEVNVESGVSLELLTSSDSFDVEFTCKPIQKSVFSNSTLIINEVDIPIQSFNYPLNMIEPRFTQTNGSITVTNYGTYNAKPIIKLSGVADSVTLTKGNKSFSYTDLDGIVYIDTDEKMVYSDSMVNLRPYFNGDYIELEPNDNMFTISGDITSLEIYFDFRNSYI